MGEVDYKPLFIDKLEEFGTKFPGYSIGDMVFSMMCQMSKHGINVDHRSSLLNITDKEFYSMLDKAIREETE